MTLTNTTTGAADNGLPSDILTLTGIQRKVYELTLRAAPNFMEHEQVFTAPIRLDNEHDVSAAIMTFLAYAQGNGFNVEALILAKLGHAEVHL